MEDVLRSNREVQAQEIAVNQPRRSRPPPAAWTLGREIRRFSSEPTRPTRARTRRPGTGWPIPPRWEKRHAESSKSRAARGPRPVPDGLEARVGGSERKLSLGGKSAGFDCGLDLRSVAGALPRPTRIRSLSGRVWKFSPSPRASRDFSWISETSSGSPAFSRMETKAYRILARSPEFSFVSVASQDSRCTGESVRDLPSAMFTK